MNTRFMLTHQLKLSTLQPDPYTRYDPGRRYDAEERHQGRVAKHRAAKAARADAAQGWVDAWTATTDPGE
jgi:hypothetical protein